MSLSKYCWDWEEQLNSPYQVLNVTIPIALSMTTWYRQGTDGRFPTACLKGVHKDTCGQTAAGGSVFYF